MQDSGLAAVDRLRQLHELSTLLTRFDGVDSAVPAALRALGAALDLRAAAVLVATASGWREHAWDAGGLTLAEVRAALDHARTTFAWLARVRSNRADPGATGPPEPPTPSPWIVLPLHVAGRGLIGVLQIEGVALGELDLLFASATANQLAVALDRHEAWQRDIALRAAAEGERDRARVGEAAADWRRASAQALQERYEGLVDNLDNAFVWEADAGTLEVRYVSARVESVLGSSRRDWTDRPGLLVERVHPEDLALLRQAVDRLLDTQEDQRLEHRALSSDDRVVWLQTGMHLAGGDSSAPTVHAVSVDITPAKEVEARLKEQLAFTRALSQSLGEGVVAADLAGRITFANRAAEGLLRLRSRDIVGRPSAEIVTTIGAEGTPAKGGLERVLDTGRAVRSAQHSFLRADGTSFPVAWSAAPLRVEGRVTGGVLAFQDVSEQRSAEQALEDALRTQRHIVAVVSHDLRNPLFAVRVAARVLLRSGPGGEPDPERRRTLEVVEQSARRMARLIRDLTDFASIQTGRLQVTRRPEDPRTILADAVRAFEALAREHDQTLSGETDGLPPLVACDRERVLQVFSNLVGNAVSVSSPGAAIVLRAAARGDEVVFSVADPGPGIPADEVGRIFDAYARGRDRRYEGSGLGLSIASGIVQAHGGRIWVESTVGVGSTFSFTVPRWVVAPTDGSGSTRADGTRDVGVASPGSARAALVVVGDDDERTAIRALLEADDFRVLSASDGADALARLDEGGPRPCLVVLDLEMPELDGAAFAAELHRRGELASIPLLVVSGQHDLDAKAASLGATEALARPIDPQALLDAAHRCCAEGSRR